MKFEDATMFTKFNIHQTLKRLSIYNYTVELLCNSCIETLTWFNKRILTACSDVSGNLIYYSICFHNSTWNTVRKSAAASRNTVSYVLTLIVV